MQTAFTTKNILLAVLGIAVVGVAGFSLAGKSTTQGDAPQAPVQTEQATAPSSLKDLLASTAPSKCTVSSTNDIADSSGVVYLGEGVMRGDFTTTQKSGLATGKVIQSHMIVDKDMSYMWGDEMKMGIKIPRAQALEQSVGGEATPKQGAIDINQKSDYHCSGWAVDSSMFTPPQDISFTDMSAMMANIPTSVNAPVTGAGTAPKIPVDGEGGVSSQQMQAMCGACDQAGAGRDQCRQALGCK